MRISTFFYSIKQGIKNIWRNKMFSLASMATMAACIFLFGLFFAIVTNFQSMVKEAEEGVAVTVLFNDDITPQQIAETGSRTVRKYLPTTLNLLLTRGLSFRRFISREMRNWQRALAMTIHCRNLRAMRSI